MKKFSFLIASMLLALSIQAQAPQKFSYQTVIRNSSNQLLIGQTVSIKIPFCREAQTEVRYMPKDIRLKPMPMDWLHWKLEEVLY